MRSYLLLGTALALSSSLAFAQSTGSTGTSSPSTTSPSGTTPSTSSPSQTTPPAPTPSSQTTTTPTTGTNTNSNSRTGATGTDRQNPLAPPNTPSSVTPAVTPPNSPGSYNPNTAGTGGGSGKATGGGISGGSTASLDLKHGTRVAKLKDARTKIVGLKLVDAKGEAIGEVASVKTLRSGQVSKIVVALETGGQVTIAAGPVLFLADNNMLVTRQSAKSIQRMHRGR